MAKQPLFVKFYNLHLENPLTIVPREKLDLDNLWSQYMRLLHERGEISADELENELEPEDELATSFVDGSWIEDYAWINDGAGFILGGREFDTGYSIGEFPVIIEWESNLTISEVKSASRENRSKILGFFIKSIGYNNLNNTNLFADADTPGSFNFYQSKVDGWRNDWFESSPFLYFMLDYYAFRELIDGYIAGKIPTWTLIWFQEKIKNYKYSLQIWEDNKSLQEKIEDYKYSLQIREDNTLFDTGSLSESLGWIYEEFEELDLDKIEIDSTGIYIDKDVYYNKYYIDLDDIFADIHMSLLQLLQNKKPLRWCKAPKTQRTPKCQNIFIPRAEGKEQEYCSKKCRSRANRRKYYRKHGK